MESEQQPNPGSLGALLRQVPQRFELLQALLILEREQQAADSLGTGSDLEGELARLRAQQTVDSLGTGSDPEREVVRLRGPLLPEFAPSEISSLRLVPNVKVPGARLTLHTQVFGLGGPDGPLPYAYQEWLQQRARNRDHGTVAFLDLFQHRLLSLMYRVQQRQRVALPYRQPALSPVYQQLRALCGLSSSSVEQLTVLPERALIARAGLLANRRRSLAGFQNLLKHYFDLPVQLHGYQGAWQQIASSDQSVLGRKGRNLTLGRNALCGTRAWDEHAGIHIRLGPQEPRMAERFMPGQEAHQQLAALVAFYFGAQLRCTVSVHVTSSAILTLGHQQPAALGQGTRLNRVARTGDFRIDLRLHEEGST
ncbi:type VI secretion system baseplate subunit TssG [Pseudomonas gingeri]|uniref:Type VI secretion system baseplate subunit TssG n=1 Tax=Pseudomonas gingeri TaxID=117681 RepID=A0A7Y8BNS0_9PSED|nr:type VI secretion system baseplate subunit TssG [Pseudomonas gingeri]NWB50414.1 type VI secretion system baseplate subunit TssG [Pseudomonas gingeri]